MILKLPIVLMFICAVCLVISDTLMKKWTVTGAYLYWGAAMVMCATGLTIGAQSLFSRNLSTVIAIVNVLNIVLVIPVGWVLFREALTIRDAVGIMLAIAAIVVLEVR